MTHAFLYLDEPYEYIPGMIQLLPEPKGVSLITTDSKGTVWINNDNHIYQLVDGIFSQVIFNEGYQTDEEAIVSQSEVVNFGKEAYFYQPDKLPIQVNQALQNLLSLQIQSPFAIDKNDRLYVYLNEGLTILDHEKSQIIGRSPGDEKTAAGIHVFDDGRVWLSTAGRIWEYSDNTWQQYKLPDKTSVIYQFTQGVDGTIYGASNTEVYQFQGETVRKFELPVPGKNTLYLGTHNDGSIIYIDNQLVARLANGKWSSFLFDNVEVNSATMDHDGNIWLYTDQVVLRLDPDVFDDYRGVLTETAP